MPEPTKASRYHRPDSVAVIDTELRHRNSASTNRIIVDLDDLDEYVPRFHPKFAHRGADFSNPIYLDSDDEVPISSHHGARGTKTEPITLDSEDEDVKEKDVISITTSDLPIRPTAKKRVTWAFDVDELQGSTIDTYQQPSKKRRLEDGRDIKSTVSSSGALTCSESIILESMNIEMPCDGYSSETQFPPSHQKLGSAQSTQELVPIKSRVASGQDYVPEQYPDLPYMARKDNQADIKHVPVSAKIDKDTHACLGSSLDIKQSRETLSSPIQRYEESCMDLDLDQLMASIQVSSQQNDTHHENVPLSQQENTTLKSEAESSSMTMPESSSWHLDPLPGTDTHYKSSIILITPSFIVCHPDKLLDILNWIRSDQRRSTNCSWHLMGCYDLLGYILAVAREKQCEQEAIAQKYQPDQPSFPYYLLANVYTDEMKNSRYACYDTLRQIIARYREQSPELGELDVVQQLDLPVLQAPSSIDGDDEWGLIQWLMSLRALEDPRFQFLVVLGTDETAKYSIRWKRPGLLLESERRRLYGTDAAASAFMKQEDESEEPAERIFFPPTTELIQEQREKVENCIDFCSHEQLFSVLNIGRSDPS